MADREDNFPFQVLYKDENNKGDDSNDYNKNENVNILPVSMQMKRKKS